MLGNGELRPRPGLTWRGLGWVPLAIAVIVVVVAVQLLAGRAASDEPATASEPATVEPVEGTDLSRVTLTESAAERLDVQTQPARQASTSENIAWEESLGLVNAQTTVPYSAIIYDAHGKAWVYTETEPLTFVREPVEVLRIVGSRAVLAEGPAAGTRVVRVGAAELYGAELGVDH